MAQLQLNAQSAPIFIEFSGDGVRQLIELEAAHERVLVVGSSRQADVFVGGLGVAAVEFQIERSGQDVWLTPAYRGRGIVVNGARRRERFPITGPLMLRIGAVELALRVLTANEYRGSTGRSDNAASRLPHDYSLSLPTDTEKTSFAIRGAMLDVADTAPLPPRGAVEHVLPVQRTERLAPAVVARILDFQETQQIAPVLAPPRPSVSVGSDAASGGPSPFAHQPFAPHHTGLPAGTHSFTPPVQQSPPASEATTTFCAPTPRPAPPGSQSPAATVVTAKGRASMPRATTPSVASSFKSLVSQLGVAAQARPLAVLGWALTLSLVLALALVGATRLTHPARPVGDPRISPSATPQAERASR